MCVNNLSKVALDSAAAGIWTRDLSVALTTAPPSHTGGDDGGDLSHAPLATLPAKTYT